MNLSNDDISDSVDESQKIIRVKILLLRKFNSVTE